MTAVGESSSADVAGDRESGEVNDGDGVAGFIGHIHVAIETGRLLSSYKLPRQRQHRRARNCGG